MPGGVGGAGSGGGGGGGAAKSTKGTGSASTGGFVGGGGKSAGGGGGSTTTVNSQQPSNKPGYKPTFDTTKVKLQPGTSHTPLIPQSSKASTLPQSAVPDLNAPVGTADNPHVFVAYEKKEWSTYGAMHTNQDKEAWDSPEAYGHVYNYTKTTNPYNKGAGGKDTAATKGLDAAFKDSAVKPFEEHVILGSSQDGAFFTGANGLDIPDVFNPGQTKKFEAKNGEIGEIIDDLSGLVGQEFKQTNFVSTAIPVDKEFSYGKNVRVLFRMKPGQKAVYVSGNPTGVPGNKTASHNSISYYNTGEMEMILPRHQTLKVIDVLPTTATGSDMYEIDVIVEVVEQPFV